MIFATFLIACLCGMGLGSGGLFVVYLTVLAGYEQLTAQGLNLHFFIFSTAAAMIIHAKSHTLPIKRLIYLCALGSVGCIAGAMLAQGLKGNVLTVIFAILLIASGSIALFTEKN